MLGRDSLYACSGGKGAGKEAVALLSQPEFKVTPVREQRSGVKRSVHITHHPGVEVQGSTPRRFRDLSRPEARLWLSATPPSSEPSKTHRLWYAEAGWPAKEEILDKMCVAIPVQSQHCWKPRRISTGGCRACPVLSAGIRKRTTVSKLENVTCGGFFPPLPV